MSLLISTELFAAFLNCKYKAYLKATGTSAPASEFEKMEATIYEKYRLRACRHLLDGIPKDRVVQSPKSIDYAMQHKFYAITNAFVAAGGFSVRIDALLRSSATSDSRPDYLPVVFTPSERVSKRDKLLLALCGIALSNVQGHPPRFGRIVHGEAFNDSRVCIDKLTSTVEEYVKEIRSTTGSQFQLNDHCRVCEFRARCRRLAVEKDDLSLLRGLSQKEISKLNNKGIFTTTQLSYTFRPRRRRKARKQRPARHDQALQALAIRTDTIYVAQKPEVPKCSAYVFVDIEGIPDRDFYYLIGVYVTTGSGEQTYSLWADTKHDEPKMWQSFLDILQRHRDAAILHYGAYDARAIDRLSKQYGGDESLIESLPASCVNVLSLIYGHVYFPTYSNDLKSVASCLGFQWTEDDASGLRSLLWRQQWECRRDERLKDNLLVYNREDCIALRSVTAALNAIGESRCGPTADAPREPVDAGQLARGWPNNYKRNEFFFPELDRVNRCAYFDYQHNRVFVRTSRSVKESVRRKNRKARRYARVNKIVECSRPSQCARCSLATVIQHGVVSKTTHDLKIVNDGIRRWVVKYAAHRYLCKTCGHTFLPREYPSSTYGNTLRAWSIYQNIGLLRSHRSIVEEMRELFGFPYVDGLVQRFKNEAAGYYKETYRALLSRIRGGDLVHVDETKASVKGAIGYVWAFTNLDEVAYVYSDTREAETPSTVLDGFDGVLISDFYPAYDSIDCPQQKCLIHLIRDINDDLFKNPFDEELKALAADFTALLVRIVDTVDRYGLKQWHLNKHRADVARYFNKLLKKRLTSELARNYERRFLKNREKLFTFLEYDGVPWNNNNAENAVKRFAFLRRVIGGSSTKNGLREYLVLLSIRETLRRKNISFLQFLLDGATDLTGFCERQ